MKFNLLIFVLFLHSVELRFDRDENEIEDINDLLSKNYPRHKYHKNKQYNNDDENEYIPTRNKYPSRKKIFNNDDDDDDETVVEENSNEKSTISTTIDSNNKCLDRYEVRSEQLVKIKDLKNGAHMIRYVLLDKRSLDSKYNIKQYCMMNCCAQKTCDLAMLSDKPSHEGYKCYLFACNGSCPLTSHDDYTILLPKIDADLNSTSIDSKTIETTTSLKNVEPSKGTSVFLETSVIIFLIFGLLSTIFLIVFLYRHCRDSMKRGRKSKNYEIDADYLINGLYL